MKGKVSNIEDEVVSGDRRIAQKGKMTWLAVRTFNCRELELCDFLKKQGLEPFVPMVYQEQAGKKDADGRPQHVMKPVVHNYLFVPRTKSDELIEAALKESEYPFRIICQPDSKAYSIISDDEMREFRLLCDPEFEGSIFLTSEEAEAKIGKNVLVTQGQFAGMKGKLHRVNNKYFFIKNIANIGVMVRISRWYCKVIDD